MSRIAFPADYAERSCYLVPINASLIPLVAGALRFYEKRGTWLTDADYEAGYNAFAELQVCMMRLCVDDLIESNDRLYRMLNTAVFGVTYATISTDPLVVEPPITPHVTLEVYDQDSVMGRLDRLTQLIDNRIAGTDTPLYDELPGLKQQLQELIDATLADDASFEDMLSALNTIAGLLT